ncbi:hypothetical protein IP88_04125 [alpha proteobacterium AAP81b]|nr:hypothetical protein IP88_04125 [alpha proteobacterium AAP81b]
MGLDAELERLKEMVDCALVLERAGWELDGRESTRNAAKYRHGPGQIVIVVHEGRGWFDPLGEGRGDVVALAQRVWGGNLGQVRRALRPLANLEPARLPVERDRQPVAPIDAKAGWAKARRPSPGSPAWRYLVEERGLPTRTVRHAIVADQLREGRRGTVMFAHRAAGREVTGWEMRGPDYKGYLKGGSKALFRVQAAATPSQRVAIAESAIDALSLATLEGWATSTVYCSTGGGFGPATAAALKAMTGQGTRLVAATDNGIGGDLLAERLERLATEAGCGFGRVRPEAKDWNDQLRQQSREQAGA